MMNIGNITQGMTILLVLWIIFQVAVVVGIILLSWFYFDKRYGRRHRLNEPLQAPPPGFQRTPEVFTDPKDNRLYRVYYNSETGERVYIIEDHPK